MADTNRDSSMNKVIVEVDSILSPNKSNTVNLSFNNVSLNVSVDADANIVEEKSVFETSIIEAYKQTKSKQIYECLVIAFEEIKFRVNDTKYSHSYESNSILLNETSSSLSTISKNYLINRNIIDKLSRIIERKFFNINILVAKILEILIDPTTFNILSSDEKLLVTFANQVLNLLEKIKSTKVSRQLEKKCGSFLNYLSNLHGIDEEQKNIIKQLIICFPLRNSSKIYKIFSEVSGKIMMLCGARTIEDKIEGLNFLMDCFGSTVSLEEQFDIVTEKLPAIVNAVIDQPNPFFKQAYFQLGNFICSMLYATKYKVDAFLPYYRINEKDINKNYFFIFAGDYLLKEYEKDQISFLHNSTYELTYQKEILMRCQKIFQISILIVNTLSIYDNIFDLQFLCYLILKRIYFIFPELRMSIEDLLAATLVNISNFKEKFEKENSLECKIFIRYLLQKGEENLKNKIIKGLEAISGKIHIKKELKGIDSDLDLEDVECERVNLSDFNMKIGYPISNEVEAGQEICNYIEVDDPNSLVFIGFATQANDITFHLLKYIPSDEFDFKKNIPNKIEDDDNSDNESSQGINEEYTEGHFKPLLKLERIDSSRTPVKIVVFVPQPGTYKIIFDNTFSWFTSKKIRYRFSVMKPLSTINLNIKENFGISRRDTKGMIIGDNSNNKTFKQDFKKIPENNKILNLRIDGENKIFNVGNIYKDEKYLKESMEYLAIPILLTSDSIRIIRTAADDEEEEYEEGENIEEKKEIHILETKLDLEKEVKPYSEIIEEELINYLNSISELNIKSIFLNLFILEKKFTLKEDFSLRTIEANSNEFYTKIFSKLGFFPEKLLEKFDNVKLCCNTLANSCLIYSLYEKVFQDQMLNNIIHIHIDKYKAQACLYFEGIIHDKISSLNFDKNKSLIENIENIIEFLNKVSVVFGTFELNLSYTDIEDKQFDFFIEELAKNLSTLETNINLEKKDSIFVTNAMNAIQFFQIFE